MIQSMTGFGSREKSISGLGKVSVQLRSTNHKFLDIVFHLPDGLLPLEDKIKKSIEAKIKRGRVICVISIIAAKTPSVFVNKALLKEYISLSKNIKNNYRLKDNVSLDALLHLPGVFSLEQDKALKINLWPRLQGLVNAALESLARMRQKEGRTLAGYLKGKIDSLEATLGAIKKRFKKAIAEKLIAIESDEEKTSFLKSADITEEIERLDFHFRNFKNRLSKSAPLGKEFDFIAQEMQREANTLAAKSFDVLISSKIVRIKSLIEKVREQAQNVE